MVKVLRTRDLLGSPRVMVPLCPLSEQWDPNPFCFLFFLSTLVSDFIMVQALTVMLLLFKAISIYSYNQLDIEIDKIIFEETAVQTSHCTTDFPTHI